ncbi:MAG: DUF1311 domain-containing protein [Lachnospiraceae bacterium]|nr:DUF1311 domain-containing protein [Lachnospiraceae bacterium]
MGACDAKEEKAEPFSGEPITTIDASSEDQNQGNNAAEDQNQGHNAAEDQNQGHNAAEDQNQGNNAAEDQNQGNNANESQNNNASGKVQEFFANGAEAADFDRDYDADIQASIDAIAASSASVQEELKAVAKIAEQFDKLAGAANTQVEMNQSSKWFYVIWDKELNSLWSRISSQADAQTKEELLADQRNWVSMKEEVTLENIGSSEENGSMYPVLQYGFWEEITRNRVYVLANALAKIKGESFAMPERNAKYGTYVDNEGTGSVYSSLITRKGWEGDDEAIIALYRTGVIEGSFEDQGNGKLAFTSYDGKVKGTIALKGWDGASFEVTEASDDAIVSAGEKYDFNFVY